MCSSDSSLARQEYAPAVSMLKKAGSIDPHHERIGSLALVLGLAGRRDQAADMLQRLTDLASRSYVSPFSLAEAHAGLRHTEPWRQAMAAALEERAGLLVFLDAECGTPCAPIRIGRSCGAWSDCLRRSNRIHT